MGKLKGKSSKKTRKGVIKLILIFVLSMSVGIILPLVFEIYGGTQVNNQLKVSEKSPEIEKILSETNIDKQAGLYIRLIKRVGPEKAQEEFNRSGVPFNGQMHLLNHTVGNYIWKKYGPPGITLCKDYFSSSCYHGFIINAIGNGKQDNLSTIMLECKKESRETFVQCTHALGHGILAWQGYKNLLESLTICDEMGERVPGLDPSYCHNGVFMENIWGLHEGKPSPDRWVKAEDKYYPCNDPRIENKYLPGCWYNQAIYMMNNVYKGDLLKVGEECVTIMDQKSREMCFDAVFRSVNTVTGSDIPKKINTCNRMPIGWAYNCVSTVANASHQQGDNDLPIKICDANKDDAGRKQCFERLYGQIYYYTNRSGKYEMCMKIPEVYRNDCRN